MTSLVSCRRNRSASARVADPFRPLNSELDRVFAALFAQAPAVAGIDFQESDDGFTVRLDAPGFEPGEFDIQVTGENLHVVAEHVVKQGEKEFVERRLHRSMTLPTDINPSAVEAAYKNGVLEIRLGKSERAKWTKVPVQAS